MVLPFVAGSHGPVEEQSTPSSPPDEASEEFGSAPNETDNGEEQSTPSPPPDEANEEFGIAPNETDDGEWRLEKQGVYCIVGSMNEAVSEMEVNQSLVEVPNATLENMSDSCEAKRRLGPDPCIWAPVSALWFATRICVAYTVFLALQGFYFALSGGSVLPMTIDGGACLTWWSLGGVGDYLGVVVCVSSVIMVAFYIAAFTYCKELATLLCAMNLPCLLVGVAPGAVLAICTVLVMATLAMLIAGLFPLASKMGWFHMDRAILFCAPLPHEQSLAFGTFVFPVYLVWILYNVVEVLRAKWNYDSDKGIGQALGVSWKLQWVGKQTFDAYTDLATLIASVGVMPISWLAAWTLTSATSVLLAAGAHTGHAIDSELNFKRTVLLKLAGEDIPQLVLTACKIYFCIFQELPFDQYGLYSFLTALLSVLTLAKRYYSSGAVIDYEPLREEPAGSDIELHLPQPL